VVEADTRSLEKKELMHTADRALLLACVYFDQSHAGYLLDRDVEDIIHTTGLQLSRAQVLLCLIAYMYCTLTVLIVSVLRMLDHRSNADVPFNIYLFISLKNVGRF